ncbi:hypothetical protein OESDEN_06711 [Oesophagostomum dentatum]|uniref:Uncharacterized protein n=1 Tax=Oesophagostomum dentatum TaxID=61180 RepID=A0A0B1T7Z4_OESDE|nr:hypothetical protein OESDEN_06711 [Oesophagostomum dentatum]
MKLVETVDSGIPELEADPDNYENNDDFPRRYAKWIIGLDWTGYIDIGKQKSRRRQFTNTIF